MRLNDAQQLAVDYIDGPCLVLAGAGSGKTRVITQKIVDLIRRHFTPAQSICALTFTNKAASEMRERVKASLGGEIASKICISTFHSLGLMLLKDYYSSKGYGSNFSLFDQYDSQKLVRDIIRDHYPQILIDNSEKSVIDDVLTDISNWKTSLKRPEDIVPQTIHAQIYSDYTNYLNACHACDFEDLIFKTALLFQEDKEISNQWSSLFEYVLVDEYQDTNETQYQLLKNLTKRHNRFTVVGDDDQSIYAWRGARPENIKVLADDYKNLKVIKLEENYRSTQHILNCANTLIANNEHIFNKTLFTKENLGEKVKIMELRTETDESERVVELILAHQFRNKTSWKDYSVLYRSNSQSRSLEKAFHEARIPCFISGGTSFFEQAEIKDMLCWCRVICNPYDDMALLRVINVPRRGIGHETLNKLFDASKVTGKSLYESALNPNITNQLNPKQKKSLGDFILLLTKLRQYILNREDKALVENLVSLIGYDSYINANTESKIAKEIKHKNVKTLLSWISDLIDNKNKTQTSMNFLDAVDKLGLREMMDRQSDDDENDAVQLMTLHASKGLEFPYVYLVGMEEGTLPHKNSLPNEDNQNTDNVEEERRLAYVGITRARQELTILYTRESSKRGGAPVSIMPSRFLKELPQSDIIMYPLGDTPKVIEEEHQRAIDDVLKQLDDLL